MKHSSPEETFDGTWPYEANYTSTPGFRMYYIDEGEGETVLTLQSEPILENLSEEFIKGHSMI